MGMLGSVGDCLIYEQNQVFHRFLVKAQVKKIGAHLLYQVMNMAGIAFNGDLQHAEKVPSFCQRNAHFCSHVFVVFVYVFCCRYHDKPRFENAEA